ncbi:MAG TPA: O-antigen ligase [Candidatus Acidoferrales bacterium]
MKILEKAYLIFALIFLANGVIQTDVGENVGPRLPSSSLLIGQIFIFSILTVLVALHWREVINGVRRSGWLMALCGLAIVSAVWSVDPQFAFRRAIVLLATTMFGVYLASRFDWDEQISLFAWMSVVAIAGCWFMVVVFPQYGISHDIHFGSIKGLFAHRSMMARQMVFAILTLALARPKGMPSAVRGLGLVGAVALLAFSFAATSWVAAAVCLAVYPILHLLRIRSKRTLPLWVVLAPVFALLAYLLIANFGLVLEATGKDSTLTGRVPIWHAAISAISQRPFLGYGYQTFWNRGGAITFINPYPNHAHDGYLDLLLDMGMVGLLVFLCGFAISFWRAGKLFQSDEVNGAKWPLLFMIFFGLFNLTESNITRPLTFLWVPYCSIFVSLAMIEFEGRLPAAVPNGDFEPDGDGGGSEAPTAIPSYGA